MYSKKIIFVAAVFILMVNKIALAQNYAPYLNIPVSSNGYLMVNPWAGGLDAPIFQPIDLNGDGIEDLFVFEKGGIGSIFRFTTYINNGTPGQVDYHYAPEYEKKFPDTLHDWVLLVDYDCDGREDIFTTNPIGGITVFHNDFSVANGLSFSVADTLLHTVYFGVPDILWNSTVYQPVLADIDNDNDIDLLTSPGGANFEYHQNLAEENYGRCDTFVFNLATTCFGNFAVNGFDNSAILNIVCRSSGYHFPVMENLKDVHSGCCAIAPDLDGDGDKDFVNGSVHGDNLLYLDNGGDSSSANIISQDTCFPSYNVCNHIKTFPSAYYFDADNDGNKDLVVAPCIPNISRNFKNILFYKNTTNNSTNVFNYQGDSIFTVDMIDVGSGANVALLDADADGLQDMIIGNYKYVYQDTISDSRLAYFRNTGTASQPSFDLVTNDFAGLSTTGLTALFPTFGDLDGDGDMDMIFGTEDGYLNYYQNTAGPGNPVNLTLAAIHITSSAGTAINAGGFATPQLVDLNRDGKLDLVIGNKNGTLIYYENTGTVSSYSFSYITDALGNVNTAKPWLDIYGYSVPFLYDSLGSYILYAGTESGYIYKYNNIDGNLSGTFNLIDTMLAFEPVRSTITGTDINNDGKLDLLVGNYSGGATWYADQPLSIAENKTDKVIFNIYPNPAKELLTIKLFSGEQNSNHKIEITNVIGEIIFSEENNSLSESLNVRSWKEGMYFCKIIEGSNVVIKKLIVLH
jgi:hypothetical protein